MPSLSFESVFNTSEWRIEEHGFHVISYLHSGANKIWYTIPEKYMKFFKKIRNDASVLISPDELLSRGCQVVRCIQEEGQYVIVKPNCYYCTIATGYSCSEQVCFAPMNWFQCQTFLSYNPALSDFVHMKMLLNNAAEDVKKNPRSDHCQLLLEKINKVKDVLSQNLTVLASVGIDHLVLVKNKSHGVRSCTICSCTCYLLSVRLKNSEKSLLCIDDAMKMMIQKRVSCQEVFVESITTIEQLDSLIKKCKRPVLKNRK